MTPLFQVEREAQCNDNRAYEFKSSMYYGITAGAWARQSELGEGLLLVCQRIKYRAQREALPGRHQLTAPSQTFPASSTNLTSSSTSDLPDHNSLVLWLFAKARSSGCTSHGSVSLFPYCHLRERGRVPSLPPCRVYLHLALLLALALSTALGVFDHQ